MRISPRFMVSIALVLVLAACNLPRGAPLQNEILRDANAEDPPFQVVTVSRDNVTRLMKWPATGWSGSYHWLSNGKGPASNIIRTADVVDLVIWDSQENSLLTDLEKTNVTMMGLVVSPQGTIFVPYIDEIEVRGMTPDVARTKIQNQLEIIVPSAQVQLLVNPGQANSVDMVRGVERPGTYPLPGRNYTILSAISQAGGINNGLRNPSVRLIRGNNTYEIPAEKLFESATHNIALRGDDKIIVDEDDRYFLSFGATQTERLIYFEKEHITALEALSITGGLNSNAANPEGILILRDYPETAVRTDGGGPAKEQVVFTIDLTTADGLFAARKFQINPKDTVLATDSPVSAARTILALIGSAAAAAAVLD